MPQPDISRLAFDRCALCAQSTDLQASHIIPGFVFRWLRESSATGHFRFSSSPNRRVQDGLKPHMLCRDCEQLLSSWEKTFSEQCFAPINSGRIQNIDYGPWMLKFATSVSWRVLCAFASSGGLSGFPQNVLTETDATLRDWARFLLGSQPHPGRHEQHMFLVDVVEGTSIANTPPNISRYFTRAIDCYVARTQDAAITYAKMGKFVLFGFIAMKYPRRWKETKLHLNRGQFGVRDIELPLEVRDFIFERARLSAAMYSQISEKQQSTIRQSCERDHGRVDRSETFRAMHHDVSMFGQDAFRFTQPEIPGGANDDNE